MNTRTLIAALALAATGTAFASEATPETPFVSTASRADIHAQVLQARAAGLLPVTEADYQRMPALSAPASRAAVQAELQRAIASGELRSLNAESGSPLPGTAAHTATSFSRTVAARQ
jgi:Domain of unknown function (DUF4148)